MGNKLRKHKGVFYDISIPKEERLSKKQIMDARNRLFGKPKKVARILKPFLNLKAPMTLEEETKWIRQMNEWIETPRDASGNKKELPKFPKGKRPRNL